MSTLRSLRFGIPSLDYLFGPGEDAKTWGIQLPRDANKDREGVTSLCIAGPSGTGKSLLAMHLASAYYADCASLEHWSEETRPTIIYVSTDLTPDRAKDTWRKFALHRPNLRELPYGKGDVFKGRERPASEIGFEWTSLEIELQEQSLHDVPKLILAMERPVGAEDRPHGTPGRGEILFLNLAESTAGDDWSFVTKIMSLLRPIAESQPKHLLIIDAVEGLEMLVGETDAYGQNRSRRSRIAQLLRSAVNKSHVALVLEEKNDIEHLPEEYVTDSVLRLRTHPERHYSRRTIEVVKSRGQASVRGLHNYIIRSAKPEEKPNTLQPDDPPVRHPDLDEKSRPVGQAYIHVLHSLHCLTRVVMTNIHRHAIPATPAPPGPPPTVAPFRTPKLPGILKRDLGNHYGLPLGQVTVLTGDEATYKGRFAKAFLAGAYQDILDGVPVLITTGNLGRDKILESLHWHDPKDPPPPLTEKDGDRFVYRQLEIHDLSSPVLFNIILRCVEQALKNVAQMNGIAKEHLPPRKWWEPSPLSAQVRLVIDDWSVIQATYPAVAADHIFLPFLVRYLEGVGVTTLVIETQPGRPDQVFSSQAGRQLRSLVRNHLLTWHVPFYGEDRVAITAVPPVADCLPSVVAELRTPPVEALRHREADVDERLWGDQHFELYRGLETGSPQPVPLTVQLFAAAEGFAEYAQQANEILNRIFAPSRGANVVVALDPAHYVSTRDFSFLSSGSGTRVEDTVVFSVDEYWPEEVSTAAQRGEPSLKGYLAQRTMTQIKRADGSDGRQHCPTDDPYRTYQLESGAGQDVGEKTKGDFFPLGGSYGSPPKTHRSQQSTEWDDDWSKAYDDSGLVPYLWDFGFLLLRERAWRAATNETPTDQAVRLPDEAVEKINRVWKYCTDGWGLGTASGPAPARQVNAQNSAEKPVTWAMFLEACTLVARVQSAHHPERMLAFDTELLTSQTFACLVLEIWFSIIADVGETRPAGAPLTGLFSDFRLGDESTKPQRSLKALLSEHRYEFFRVWLLLGECVDPVQLLDERGCLQPRKAQNRAVAERHWYSTASQMWKKVGEDDPLRPARLPGRFVTRGDWFLTIAPESRSRRLGERAMDLLSRRRANLLRLELGIGLPVRDILFEHEKKHEDEVKKATSYRQLDTALGTVDSAGFRRVMNYQELRELGVAVPKLKRDLASKQAPGARLSWLWRSQIPNYHRHDRVLERWIGRFLRDASRWNQGFRAAGSTGFNIDKVIAENPSILPDAPMPGLEDAVHQLLGEAWDDFKRKLDVMVEELDKLTFDRAQTT